MRQRMTCYVCPHCGAGFSRLVDGERHRESCATAERILQTPSCKTCPCEANGECLKDPVQVVFGADGQVERVIEAHARSGGYCSCHPLYGEWEKQELARRMMDGGTK